MYEVYVTKVIVQPGQSERLSLTVQEGDIVCGRLIENYSAFSTEQHVVQWLIDSTAKIIRRYEINKAADKSVGYYKWVADQRTLERQ